MEVRASVKYLRMSPRKLRLVGDAVKGMPAQKAVTVLEFMNKKAAQPIKKLLESAIANAKHNHQLVTQNLVIKSVIVNEGPTMYRYTPKAFGRATPLRKRTSHVIVTLDEMVPTGFAKAQLSKQEQEETQKNDVSVNTEMTQTKGRKKKAVSGKAKALDAQSHEKDIIDPRSVAKATKRQHQEKKQLHEKKQQQQKVKAIKNKV